MSQGKNLTTGQLRGICEDLLCRIPQRGIASRRECSASTVSRIRDEMQEAGLDSAAALEAMGDQALVEMHFGKGKAGIGSDGSTITVLRESRRKSPGEGPEVLVPDFDELADFVIENRVQRALAYADYRRDCCRERLKPVCRTVFYERLRAALRRKAGPSVYMPQARRYGEAAAIDYCGDTFRAVSPEGVEREYAVVVLAWAASNMVYAELIAGQDTASTCIAVAHALQRWQCAPRVLLCDNAKSMVTSHRIGREPVFNQAFIHYMHQLDISVEANNPYSPSSKGFVELSVRLVQDRALTRMRTGHAIPLGLAEANAELSRLVDSEINAAGFRDGMRGTPRRELFDLHEAPAARKLPQVLPEFRNFTPAAKVGRDYLVRVGGCRYSVPWRLAGRFVSAEWTATRVYIYGPGRELVAEHPIGNGDAAVVNPAHMPERHRAVALKRASYPDEASVIREGGSISPILGRYCEAFFRLHGFTSRNGPISVIARYKAEPEMRGLFDAALARLMDSGSGLHSHEFEKEAGKLKAMCGSAMPEVDADFATRPGQEHACLRGPSAFKIQDPEPGSGAGGEGSAS